MRRPVLLLTLTLLVAAHAAAEVRITRGSDGGPDLLIKPVAGQVWRPAGNVDDSVLNPLGDLAGDGFPVVARDARALVAAWPRSADGSLQVLWSANGSRRQSRIPAQTLGSPLVQRTSMGALVAWQATGPGREVWMSTVTELGESEPVLAANGTLIALLGTNGTLHVLTWDASGGSVTDVPVAMLGGSIPYPIPLPAETLAIEPLVSSPNRGATATAPAVSSLHALSLCSQSLDGSTVLLTWMTSTRGVIGYARITEGGVDGESQFLDGPAAASCPALLNAVERHLDGR